MDWSGTVGALQSNLRKKEVKNRVVLTAAWLAVITLLRWRWNWDLLGFWVGGLLGTFLLDIDHLVYTLFVYPQEPTSQKVRALVQEGRFQETLILLRQTEKERTRLSFHNAGFQVVFCIFTLFVLTSTGNLFGAGLVMAMSLHLLQHEFELLLGGGEKQLREWLFWLLVKPVSLPVQKAFVFTMLLVFLGLNLFLI